MPQEITTSIAQLVTEARGQINEIAAVELAGMLGREDIAIVDLRDVRELQRDGKIPGAFHCPRGMLEFWIDPASPYHKPIFAEDRHFIFYCASGWRSALSAAIAQRMGLKPVSHVVDGYSGWKKTGAPVESVEKR